MERNEYKDKNKIQKKIYNFTFLLDDTQPNKMIITNKIFK